MAPTAPPSSPSGTDLPRTLAASRGEVSVRDLYKSFTLNRAALAVLRGLNLSVAGGESLAIVGPSGCGKTTLLRVLAGLETPDRGSVLIDGRPVVGVGTERAIIYQEPRLLPWANVLANVAFGLEVRGTPRARARERARHYLRLVGLEAFETALPRQLSGGMAQRVGIARALTVQPEILLLDEPLAALDAMTKLTVQEELARIWAEEKVTMILVTHDLEEAIYLADRVLVLSRETELPPRLLDVPLPRPRDRNAPEFVALRRDLMRSFGLH
ncbi:NitT/TauT family transport system ATP-binding protein/sulfonate transport system ATP-binding protein [Rhodobacter viridis]|uniref:NitT/TauT family transport system ATP-binding protein/sulfonate transport system ATP-binding protein n=1 Tax=Rhodobacter viridis TaxID=1054202 RepID=A0A318U2L0_9RHOB|nr:NitT/TauT family transport system ATP-binding protein/sulfonate transport system ATP-binding protein [Rhodobacter viridis]